MTINQVILGVLSLGQYTGYDLKKIIADNEILPWSGNNNQIYKALLELKEMGWVTSEAILQDSAPNKKVYSLSAAGREALRTWLLDETKPSEIDNSLLVKLLFTGVLMPDELKSVLEAYRQELQVRLLAHSAQVNRQELPAPLQPQAPDVSGSVATSLDSSYSGKIQRLTRQFLADQLSAEIGLVDNLLAVVKDQEPGVNGKQTSPAAVVSPLAEAAVASPLVQAAAAMAYPQGSAMQNLASLGLSAVPKTRNGNRYIEISSTAPAIHSESDVVDLLAFCSQYETRLLLIESNVFSDDFYRIKTGLAGSVLQKLANYHVRAALIRHDDQKIKGKFYDFLLETNRGHSFRIFDEFDPAVDWLCK